MVSSLFCMPERKLVCTLFLKNSFNRILDWEQFFLITENIMPLFSSFTVAVEKSAVILIVFFWRSFVFSPTAFRIFSLLFCYFTTVHELCRCQGQTTLAQDGSPGHGIILSWRQSTPCGLKRHFYPLLN